MPMGAMALGGGGEDVRQLRQQWQQRCEVAFRDTDQILTGAHRVFAWVGQ
jgi:hypothetical protein